MALTTLQAQDQYILDSFAQFLDRTVKDDYDPVAAATATATSKAMQYPKALTIREAKSDDITIVRAAPSIAIAMAAAAPEHGGYYEIGSSAKWRARSFLLSCYPSLDANGAPCSWAAKLLRSFVTDAFSGSEAIAVMDFTNPQFSASNKLFTGELMMIRKASAPIDRAQTTALAEEKHRFDVHVTVEYVVAEKIRT